MVGSRLLTVCVCVFCFDDCNSKSLTTVVVPWVGVPEPIKKVFADFPHLAIHNIHHNSVPVAEMTLSLMLSCAKNSTQLHQAMLSGKWLPGFFDESIKPLSLTKKRATILGFGELGQAIAKQCRAFDMHLVCVLCLYCVFTFN